MYRAVVFDLDGTLVQTEKLKALSYALAASELSEGRVDQEDVVEEFKKVVGGSRKEVAQHLLEAFDLAEAAEARMEELDVDRPWQAYLRVRLRIYTDMLDDSELVREHCLSHNIELLERVRENDFKTALATMSHCEQASRVMEILGIRGYFDFVATRDEVENSKPDPEIYILCAAELDVPPEECLVIEDSSRGVRAARAAGMDVIAVTSPFTRDDFGEEGPIERRWVVRDPEELGTVMWERLLAHQRDAHGG